MSDDDTQFIPEQHVISEDDEQAPIPLYKRRPSKVAAGIAVLAIGVAAIGAFVFLAVKIGHAMKGVGDVTAAATTSPPESDEVSAPPAKTTAPAAASVAEAAKAVSARVTVDISHCTDHATATGNVVHLDRCVSVTHR